MGVVENLPAAPGLLGFKAQINLEGKTSDNNHTHSNDSHQ